MKRSKFNLSNYKLLTCDMGELVPVNLTEVLPGDTIDLSTSMLLRVSPMVAPVMHPVEVRVHHWFVPHRILWTGWESFITGGSDGLGDGVGAPPTVSGTNTKGSLDDYFGVPIVGSSFTRSALPRRAYNAIFNDHYRDPDLVTARTVDDGTVARVAWEKDYFTSARPWPQRGPAVTVPLGTSAPVVTNNTDITVRTSTDATSRTLTNTANQASVNLSGTPPVLGGNLRFLTSGLQADLSAAVSPSVLQLRRAFALQRYAEARARYGARYTEYLRYLGIKPSDARLQDPEYLGGGKQMISFSEVLSTSAEATGGSAVGLGVMGGHGIAALRTNRCRKFFEEHGFVLSLMSVRPKTMYSQGLHRMFTRTTKEDFYTRELETVGQQEVFNREVFVDGTAADANIFGYQDRYDEYRRSENTIAADFRDTFNFWHMARIFGSRPALNSSFVTADPTKRIHAVQTNDVLWIMAQNRVVARRMMGRVAQGRIV